MKTLIAKKIGMTQIFDENSNALGVTVLSIGDCRVVQIKKNKIELRDDMNVNAIYEKVKNEFKQYQILTIDGVKIDFPDGWVHLRTSNTEPIMRVYAESTTEEQAQKYADKIINLVKSI